MNSKAKTIAPTRYNLLSALPVYLKNEKAATTNDTRASTAYSISFTKITSANEKVKTYEVAGNWTVPGARLVKSAL
jgi:hypothetical protein